MHKWPGMQVLTSLHYSVSKEITGIKSLFHDGFPNGQILSIYMYVNDPLLSPGDTTFYF